MISLNTTTSSAFGKLRIASIATRGKEFSDINKDFPNGANTPEEKLALRFLKDHSNNKTIQDLEKKGFDVKVGVFAETKVDSNTINSSMNNFQVVRNAILENRKTKKNTLCWVNIWNNDKLYDTSKIDEKAIHKEQTQFLAADIESLNQLVNVIKG